MTFPSPAPPLGVVTLSVGATAAGFSGANAPPAGSQFAVISIETATVRFRDDGVAPTASVGVLLPLTATLGEPWVYSSIKGLSTIQFIATSGTAAVTAAFYGGSGFV